MEEGLRAEQQGVLLEVMAINLQRETEVLTGCGAWVFFIFIFC